MYSKSTFNKFEPTHDHEHQSYVIVSYQDNYLSLL